MSDNTIHQSGSAGQDPTPAFIEHMRACGIGPADPSQIIDDNKRRRYRLEGDKPKKLNGSYQLACEPDGFAFGWAMSFKDGTSHAWHSKSSRKFTDAEKAEHKRKAAAAKSARVKEENRLAAAAAAKAQRLWDSATTAGQSEYLDRKGVGLNGARLSRGVVVVPLRVGVDLVNLQFIRADGEKRFLAGGKKKGAYFSIARKGDDLSRIVICEGFATGGSLRAALPNTPIIVAFDAGNLKPVAQAMRKRYPDAEIIMAADNDQWTTKQDGSPHNPGVEGAKQAAVAIGGARVIAPSVSPDDEARRTDWNDMAATDGPEPIVEAFAPRDDIEGPPIEAYDDYSDAVPVSDPLAEIRPLGHNRGVYYFFPRTSGQIVALSASSLGSMQNYYRLAPRDFWESHYGGAKDLSDSKICAFASAHLMAECHRLGVFEAESTRGIGAWLDRGRVVINAGDVVECEGVRWSPPEFRGEAVYESGFRAIDLDAEPLANAEAAKLRDICRRLNWRRPLDADLLAGWLVVAPVGGALHWRPHIWLTGRSGSGKSAVLEYIIKPVAGPVAISRDGGTTEPGVRMALGMSGRPFILDEAESETRLDRSQMERIVFLARRASSGGVVTNANGSFMARSCFCFSAINPRVEQTADRSRITQIELVQDVSADRAERWQALTKDINALITPDFHARLLSRTIANMPTLLENIRTFSMAAAAVIGNMRAGDQFGAMLAGAYALTSTKAITYEAAVGWMQRQDWRWCMADDEESDAYKLVSHIMTYRASYDVGGYRREGTLGELIQWSANTQSEHSQAATDGLRPYGIRVKDGRVYIANQSPQLRAALADTPWIPWGRTLGDYPDADNNGAKALYFAPGLTSKCTSIPLASIMQDEYQDPGDAPDLGEIQW